VHERTTYRHVAIVDADSRGGNFFWYDLARMLSRRRNHEPETRISDEVIRVRHRFWTRPERRTRTRDATLAMESVTTRTVIEA